MNKDVAKDFVIRELGRHRQRNDIIQKLCELNGVNWRDAERFVQQVEAENQNTIALKQSPMVTIIGLGFAIGGFGLMAWDIGETLHGTIIFLFYIPWLGNISLFFTGLAMMLGGIWGMWETILRIWNN